MPIIHHKTEYGQAGNITISTIQQSTQHGLVLKPQTKLPHRKPNGLSSSQTNISSETQPENLLALLPRNMIVAMAMVMVGMAQMPPSGDFVNGIVVES